VLAPFLLFLTAAEGVELALRPLSASRDIVYEPFGRGVPEVLAGRDLGRQLLLGLRHNILFID